MEEKVKIVSDDHGSKLHQVDKELVGSAASGEGLIEIKSVDQLMELANMAHERFQEFRRMVNALITDERAKEIRVLRVDQDYSWRKIAAECHERYQGQWTPESNQLAGMALCEAAAEFFNEHYMSEPWN